MSQRKATCNPVKYPLGLWIKMSFVFAFSTSVLIAIGSFSAGFVDPFRFIHVCTSFVVILIFAICNICIHIYYQVENPIKSPLHVKAISFGIGFIIMYLTHYFETHIGVEYPNRLYWDEGNHFRNIIFISVQAFMVNFVVLLWLYFLMSEYNKAHHILERSRLERSREEAINLMLRQQIQPHFLFNALTTLKSLIKKDKVMAENYLMKLSDFLRRSIASVKDGEVATVDKEIKLCEDYLDMQKIRFGDAVHYSVLLSPNGAQKFLPVFSLQPLVDNALKHNMFTNENPIYIEIKECEGWIVVANTKNIRQSKLDSNGSGLANLKERYRHLHADGLQVEEDENMFYVKLKIVE